MDLTMDNQSSSLGTVAQASLQVPSVILQRVDAPPASHSCHQSLSNTAPKRLLRSSSLASLTHNDNGFDVVPSSNNTSSSTTIQVSASPPRSPVPGSSSSTQPSNTQSPNTHSKIHSPSQSTLSSSQISTNILEDLKEAFRLKSSRKGGDIPLANKLFKDAIALLSSLPALIHIEKQSELDLLKQQILHSEEEISLLQSQLAQNSDQLQQVQNDYFNLLDQQNTRTDDQHHTAVSPTRFLGSILNQVDSKISYNLSAFETRILQHLDSKLADIASSKELTPSAQQYRPVQQTAKGAIILAPNNPLPNTDKPSYLAALKNSLSNSGVDKTLIAATHDSRSGSLIIKCKHDQDLIKLEHSLSKDREVNKLAKISRKGPRKTRLIIKNIPYDIDDKTLHDSLHTCFKGKYAVGRYFEYKNKEAFSQVITVEDDPAKLLLSSQSPSIQIGMCYYPVDIYVPITRCFNCQAFGHTFHNCKRKNCYCAICGYSGHTSQDCSSKDPTMVTCINCYSYNSTCSNSQAEYDANHEAFSKNCPIYKNYFTKAYNNILSSIIPSSAQSA